MTKFFPHISFRDEVFLISCLSPRPWLQRQSVNVWPARRWAQYEITFRAWLRLCISSRTCSFEIFFLIWMVFPHISFRKEGFLIFSLPPLPRLQRRSVNVCSERHQSKFGVLTPDSRRSPPHRAPDPNPTIRVVKTGDAQTQNP